MAPSDDKSLKQIAKEKQTAAPSQLGDPVSLKAETSDNQPTEQDKPNKAPNKQDNRSLKEVAQDKMKQNPSQLGDPVSLKAETSDTEPTADDRGTLGTQKTGKQTSKPKL
ncbi:hypothetical protein BAUCODRAFT_205121 [Baudoinia panamericana UAMH 10762]|uniref:Uncharacterized protein n=1 Tax=Baudoinia panamericana (strain UAMH 10762) TaxID=717646 RepID=M2MWD1_BAUPA|nr:uncharacterized protein BAUCODRAFT_205121 [Baudoinia panamericana UAMH 10762]EMD01302.1 hypothetical protein BAUCODRAFT_205121 [Baudoinia panamericana UAMH 10762]